jgi:hypothetical protein
MKSILRHRTFRLLLLVTILTVATAATLTAQHRDILISTRDNGYRPLIDTVLQAADSAHGEIAVVWSASGIDTNNSIALTLYMQLVRNGVATGVPLKLGGKNWKILPQFRVAALGENFLVLYLVRISFESVGIYSQLFDSRTLTLGEPHLVLTQHDFAVSGDRKRMSVFGSPESGWEVLWYEGTYAQNRLFGCHFDARGVPEREAEVVSGFATEILSFDRLPGIRLLIDSFGVSRILYTSNGRFDPRPLPFLSGPFHLGRDTSLTILLGDTLFVYPSIFNTGRAIRRTLPMRQWGLDRQQALVYRDDFGKIHLYFAIGRNGDPASGRHAGYAMVRMELDPALHDFLATDTLFTDEDTGGPLNDKVFYYRRSMGCGNQWRLSVLFGTGESAWRMLHVTLDDWDQLRRVDTLDTVRCGTMPWIEPCRLANDSVSAVLVPLPVPVRLSVSNARRAPPAHTIPGIVAYPDGIVCTWREADVTPVDRLCRWIVAADTIDTIRTFSPPEPPIGGTPYGATSTSGTSGGDNANVPLQSDAGLTYNSYFQSTVDGYYPSEEHTHFTADMAGSSFVLARPRTSGWQIAGTVIERNTYTYPPLNTLITTGRIIGSNPRRGSIMVAMTTRSVNGGVWPAVLRCHELNGTYWDVAPGGLYAWRLGVIPIGDSLYMLFDTTRGCIVRGVTVLDTFSLRSAGYGSFRYFVLPQGRVARTSWASVGAPRFRIEVFDGLGLLLDTLVLDRPRRSEDAGIVCSDSTITLLFPGPDGLRATLLDDDLAILAADTLVSNTHGPTAHPSGAFRGDTLFAVWEDLRNQVTRIYANFLPVPHRAGRDSSAGVPSQVLRAARPKRVFLSPNPVHDAIAITGWTENTEGLELTISSPLGTLMLETTVFTGSAGEHREIVDLGALPDGVYMARLRSGERALTQSFVKY